MVIKRFLGFAFYIYKNLYLEFHSEEVLNSHTTQGHIKIEDMDTFKSLIL